MNFYKEYKKTVITAALGVIVVGVLPAMSWTVKAWADGRYVQQDAIIHKQISDIDDTLFEVGQDIVEAAGEDDPGLKAKLNAREEYYQRKKEALEKELDDE